MLKAIKKVPNASKTIKIPAFWDLHTHGVSGIDFMNASPLQMRNACEILGSRGICAFTPTLLTASMPELIKSCRNWGNFIEKLHNDPTLLSDKAAIPLGLHLEGPYLNPAMSGAHPKEDLLKPSISQFDQLFKAARGHIAIVTLAPELSGALTFIKHLKKLKIRVQIGHTIAQKKEVLNAIMSGAVGVTHLYNAMKIHHRSPGVLPYIHQKRLSAELITDGIHIDPELVTYLWSSLRDQIYSVTDSCSALGAKPKQKCTLGSVNVVRKGNAAYVRGTPIMAGGATWQTDHPKLYKERVQSNLHFFQIFYKMQSQFFKHSKLRPRVKTLFFDKTSWRFLGVAK